MSIVQGVCPDCKQKQHAAFQENIDEHIQKIKDKLPGVVHVQKGFLVDEEEKEYMWVQVSAFEESTKTLYGTLDNDPQRTDKVAYGDAVSVKYDEIIAMI